MVTKNTNKPPRQYSSIKIINGMHVHAYQNNDGTLRLTVKGQCPKEREPLVSDIILQINKELGGNSVSAEPSSDYTYAVSQKKNPDEKSVDLTLEVIRGAITFVVTHEQVGYPLLPR